MRVRKANWNSARPWRGASGGNSRPAGRLTSPSQAGSSSGMSPPKALCRRFSSGERSSFPLPRPLASPAWWPARQNAKDWEAGGFEEKCSFALSAPAVEWSTAGASPLSRFWKRAVYLPRSCNRPAVYASSAPWKRSANRAAKEAVFSRCSSSLCQCPRSEAWAKNWLGVLDMISHP